MSETADAVEILARHAIETGDDDIPADARAAGRTFTLDSLGVGVAGSRGPFVPELVASHAGVGESRVLGRRERLPASAAALVNAYQIHNSEFDCVHEAAVVHPMAVLLGATLAWIDRERSVRRRTVSGRELLSALVLGVDVACHLGLASRCPLRFFRPATAGAFAATAALARLAGLDCDRTVSAMGITLGQLCGTMQAHSEGSALLAMQVGFNARNALVACDLAAQGVPGPRNVLQGQFGYLALFEGESDLGAVLDQVGRTWRICEVAHKPFPSGRATHGIVDACLTLAREHDLRAGDVASVRARVPPLTHRLIGRRPGARMQVSYARLCGAFVAARALLTGGVGLDDFAPPALADPVTAELAGRIEVAAVDHPDPNALGPVHVDIETKDASRHSLTVGVVYGNPARPMSRGAQLAKFRNNCRASVEPLETSACERLIAQVETLDEVSDSAGMLDALVPAA